jgi:hypothetical protein
MNTQTTMNTEVYQAALIAQRVSLSARLDAASGYILNTGLQLECELLRNQITAIDAELYKCQDTGS